MDAVDGLQARAEGLGHVPPADEGQPDHGAGQLGEPDLDLGQAVVDEEEEDDEGGVARELHVASRESADCRHPRVADRGAQEPDRDGEQDAQRRDLDGDEHRPTVDGQIAPDDLWIHARP